MTDNKEELKSWVNEYIRTHVCSRCHGTGAVPSDDPYEPENKKVCRDCDGHGIYPRPVMPSSDEILKQMSESFRLSDYRQSLQRKRALCDVMWGVYEP